MKKLIDYINENMPEFKEYDLDGKRKARTLSLNSENLFSVKQKIDIALNGLKTGYFLRIISENEVAMCFYNIPLEDDLNLIIKLLKDYKDTEYYIVNKINTMLTITNFK